MRLYYSEFDGESGTVLAKRDAARGVWLSQQPYGESEIVIGHEVSTLVYPPTKAVRL